MPSPQMLQPAADAAGNAESEDSAEAETEDSAEAETEDAAA